MAFNPERQYRCTIIRGRAKTDLDNLLPAYANILQDICPCRYDFFAEEFCRRLKSILPSASHKALQNHRTEIAGSLFGMYYVDESSVVRVSQRTHKLLRDNDQPAFFKELCYKFQFPNGMDKSRKTQKDIANKIQIRQCAFILELLRLAKSDNIILTKKEIGYYVLNGLEVLQGVVPPAEVLKTIAERRRRGIKKAVPGGSRGRQHINETFNYLELANVIKLENDKVRLNDAEQNAIHFIASSWNAPLLFDVTQYNLDTPEGRHKLKLDWGKYYSNLSSPDQLDTPIEAVMPELGAAIETEVPGEAAAVGDEGERYIFQQEKNRVKACNSRLVNKVIYFGKIRGLGYDIQSVIGEGRKAEHAIYIEVKSTKRVTQPVGVWIDTVNLTRNEWVAAEQHRDSFFIFRVYFTPEKVLVFKISDPITKNEQKIITITPTNYRIDFDNKSGGFLS